MPTPCERCIKQGMECYGQAGGKGCGVCYECGKIKLKCTLKDKGAKTANHVPMPVQMPMPMLISKPTPTPKLNPMKPSPKVSRRLRKTIIDSECSSIESEEETRLATTIYIDKGKARGKHRLVW